ncbi:MAG: hypothetical protein COV29_03865 [Candidatus Yanofskybacteria bacterium CG10_big_fil_rev_8_21_14_0_10_36_16]|uniref:LysM domain-containing protein n=1 Tax=Candidatus Yanofskybacteria bacterium CG10_big_fil_rev_8_21_14_0_10_36_16 TaxID=1975096 RepID=A0A2J0Q6M7_9BACT|nr:MAG: hypothetical protein COV29_03865 [Candidatus Yanofskybacteria bacterium CG10_big_fil_rev_8_21_14_0_10_36_16]
MRKHREIKIAVVALAILAVVVFFGRACSWTLDKSESENTTLNNQEETRISSMEATIKSLDEERAKLIIELNQEKNRTKCGNKPCDGRCYGVQRGDNLSSIALRFYGKVSALKKIAEVNGIKNSDEIFAESCICLPAEVEGSKLNDKNTKKKATRVGHAKTDRPYWSLMYPTIPTPIVVVESPKQLAVAKLPRVETKVIENKPVEEVGQAPSIRPGLLMEQKAQTALALMHALPPKPSTPQEQPAKTEGTQKPKTNPPLVLPGSAWNSSGNLSPVEEGNFQNYSYVEQGITVWRNNKWSLVPYVSVSNSVDTKGYSWNNRITGQLGTKMVKSFGNGLVQFGGGYMHENRRVSDQNEGQAFGFGSYWFGWDTPSSNKAEGLFSAFPGSSWGMIGNTSPAEENNIIGTVYLQQGVTLAKINRVSLIPFVENTVSFDTKDYAWNNRNTWGAGIKASVPVKSGIVEIGAKHLDEYRWQVGKRASGVTGFVNLWFGWNPPWKNQ